jgi:hypothetical protein
MKQKEAKFEIGQKVTMSSKTLYGEVEGVIIERTKIYKVVTRISNGRSFHETNGLVHEERHIHSICLPYRFDGNTLEIDYPQKDYGSFVQKAFTTISEFCGYSYTIKTPKMLTSYSERKLRKI